MRKKVDADSNDRMIDALEGLFSTFYSLPPLRGLTRRHPCLEAWTSECTCCERCEPYRSSRPGSCQKPRHLRKPLFVRRAAACRALSLPQTHHQAHAGKGHERCQKTFFYVTSASQRTRNTLCPSQQIVSTETFRSVLYRKSRPLILSHQAVAELAFNGG